MQSLKTFFEWYLDTPESGPGEGTAWRIEALSIGPAGWPLWLVAGIAFLLVAGILVLYFRDAQRLPRSRRLLLVTLRLTALALVAVMLSQVTLAIDRTGLPVVAILVDRSASMGLSESSGGSSSTGSTRIDLVREQIVGDEARFLRSLARRFRIRVYRFDSDAVPLVAGDAGSLSDVVERLQELSAEGPETRPGAAARRVLDELRGVSPNALVIFTDGVSTTGDEDRLSSVATLAARRRVPLYPVGVGSGGPSRDLELYELVADDIAFLGDPVRVIVKYRSFGLVGKPVAITVTDRESGEVLAEKRVEAVADGSTSQTELMFTPEREGEIDLVVRLKTNVSEANLDNNTATRHVSVREQRVRVLLADHAPRYEFRYLKSLLEREPTIELDTVLQEADLGFSGDDRTALERFPLQKEELIGYDVIIFGDLDPGLLGAEVLTALSEFVREKGGGFIGIAGPEFFPMRYVGTPLEPVLPVDASRVTVPLPDAVLADPFRPQLTLQGRSAGPIFRFDPDEAESLAIWNRLPGLYWRADAPTLRSGAVTFAEAPDISGQSRPVIVMQRYGAGKSLLHLTDETWRWRFRSGDLYFGKYWIQAIRYLSRAALVGRDQGAILTTDRRTYVSGEPVVLGARFLDERLISEATSGTTVVVEDRSGARHEVSLTRINDVSESFEGRLDRLPEGNYHAWIRQPVFTGAPPSADFRIEPPEQELTRRTPDLADLRRAAERSGGKYFDLSSVGTLPRQLPAGRSVRLEAATPRPLWNRPELLLALVGVLTAEWLLRKRARLV